MAGNVGSNQPELSLEKSREKEYRRQARMRALSESRDNGSTDERLKQADKIFKWLTRSVK